MTETRKWWESSQGAGLLKLRIKAFIPLVVPLLNTLGEKMGVNLVPEDFDIVLDASFVLVAAFMQIWGWLRAKYPLG